MVKASEVYLKNMRDFNKSKRFHKISGDMVKLRIMMKAKRKMPFDTTLAQLQDRVNSYGYSYQRKQFMKVIEETMNKVGEENRIGSFLVNRDEKVAFYLYEVSSKSDYEKYVTNIWGFIEDLVYFDLHYPDYRICAVVGGNLLDEERNVAHAVAISMKKDSTGQFQMDYLESNPGYTKPVVPVLDIAQALDFKYDIKPKFNRRNNFFGECAALSLDICFRMLAGLPDNCHSCHDNVWKTGEHFNRHKLVLLE